MLSKYSAFLLLLRHQKKGSKANQGLLAPSTKPPPHPIKLLFQGTALRPLHQEAPGLIPHFSAMPRGQGMTQVAFSTGPSLLVFLSAQPLHSLPVPIPSALCHTLTPTLSSLQDFLPPPGTRETKERCYSSETWLLSSHVREEVLAPTHMDRNWAPLPWIPGMHNFQGASRWVSLTSWIVQQEAQQVLKMTANRGTKNKWGKIKHF